MDVRNERCEHHEVSWALGKPIDSPFAHPRGLRGRLAGWSLALLNRRDQREMVELLRVRDDERVLEVGYGPGVLVRLLAERTGAALVAGVDPSPEMQSAARRRTRRATAGRVDLRLGRAEATGFPDASFDVVVTVNTVAIWPDLRAGLRELRRVTAPGGRVAVAWHGRAARSRIARGLGLPEKQLARIHDGLAELFGAVERHELTNLTVFLGRPSG
jgi:SAM-dependent methyltransferase